MKQKILTCSECGEEVNEFYHSFGKKGILCEFCFEEEEERRFAQMKQKVRGRRGMIKT